MNKKFIVSTIILFIALSISSYLVHGVLLKPEYQQLGSITRSEAAMKDMCSYMLLAHLIAAGAIVWLYRKGKEAKPFLGQGVRFGLAISLLYVATYLIYYVVQPISGMLAVRQMVFDTIGTTLCCVILAWWESRG